MTLSHSAETSLIIEMLEDVTKKINKVHQKYGVLGFKNVWSSAKIPDYVKTYYDSLDEKRVSLLELLELTYKCHKDEKDVCFLL